MNHTFPAIPIADFHYDLPAERIATHPEHPRHHSRLLIWGKNGITDKHFYDLPGLIPSGSFVVFNNTRVIPARLIFPVQGAKHIEVFLLNPLNSDWTIWECQVGGRSRFKETRVLTIAANGPRGHSELLASWHNRDQNQVILKASGGLSIPEALELFGKTPLPPYIKRDAEKEDLTDYQTVFAKEDGAVAAPTASLHFSEEILGALEQMAISYDYLTLHVGLGTFKPVTAATADRHEMHAERFAITVGFLENLIGRIGGEVIAGGTTAMRVLESLFYAGAALILDLDRPMEIAHNVGFQKDFEKVELKESLEALRNYAQSCGGRIEGRTSIFIVPGFRFRICTGLITNFHQPGSTLLLLVAAFVGEDWKKIYAYALGNDYRFLSYGDASLLWRAGGIG